MGAERQEDWTPPVETCPHPGAARRVNLDRSDPERKKDEHVHTQNMVAGGGVVNRYNDPKELNLGLTDAQRVDLAEYLKSI